jgi:hypothetical protein
MGSRGSVVDIATGYRSFRQILRPTLPSIQIVAGAHAPEVKWLWGPPNLLYNGYQGSFSGGKSAGA